jgi:hypothetical protein
MTKPPAPPALPLPVRLLTATVDPRHPRLRATIFVELAFRDLVLLHDALVILQTQPGFQLVPAATEELEILIRRLATVLLAEGVR